MIAGITIIDVAETVMNGQTACGWPLGSVSIRLWRITERRHVLFDFSVVMSVGDEQISMVSAGTSDGTPPAFQSAHKQPFKIDDDLSTRNSSLESSDTGIFMYAVVEQTLRKIASIPVQCSAE